MLGEVKPCLDPLPSVSWTERSETSGLPSRPDDGRPTEEAVFIAVDDFDLDGDLDLYVVNYGEANLLYLNDGSGTFTECPVGFSSPVS